MFVCILTNFSQIQDLEPITHITSYFAVVLNLEVQSNLCTTTPLGTPKKML
jgi:hypothetical protein